MDWIDRAERLLTHDRAVVRVTLIEATGPTPREVGAGLLVTSTACEGRIGRGELQSTVIGVARRMLAEAAPGRSDMRPLWLRETAIYPTGPVLGASSGGTKTLLFELLTSAEIRALARPADARSTVGLVALRPLASGASGLIVGSDQEGASLPPSALAVLAALRSSPGLTCTVSSGAHGRADGWLAEHLSPPSVPFYVYGTGLIARALVRALTGLPFEVVWIDHDLGRLPPSPPARVVLHASDQQPELARNAPAGAFHAVMTVSHELDFAIVRAVLETGRFGYLGVIGSRIKRKRLEARLTECGIPAERLARLVCPIGLPGIESKAPAVIAISIAAQALQALQADGLGTSAQPAAADPQPAGSKR